MSAAIFSPQVASCAGCHVGAPERRSVVDSAQAASCGDHGLGSGAGEGGGEEVTASKEIQRLIQREAAILEVQDCCAETCAAHTGSNARQVQVRCRQDGSGAGSVHVHGVSLRGGVVRLPRLIFRVAACEVAPLV